MAERNEERYRDDDWRRERGYGRDYGRDRDRDRGFFERAGDEVRSWLGDDEAERRRRIDEARYGRDWDRYGREGYRYDREPERYGRESGREYGRDWDYGHRLGLEYGRPRGERDTAPLDFWRPGWPSQWDRDAASGGSMYTRMGYSGSGPFTGRGPRGYQRTDDRIREDVCERLTADPWIDATDIEVTVRGGDVTLSGSVRDRSDKRHAEDIADRVSGVREVHNTLRAIGGFDNTPGREQTVTAGTPTAVTTSRR